jgi:hypothetical protein
MRIIEKCWVDLTAGYQTVLSLEAHLRSEWQRAIEVVERREELAANTRRRQIRNIAGIAFLAFLFVCVLCCIGVYYIPESRIQFLLWSCVLAFPGVASGVVYVIHLGEGPSKKRPVTHPSFDLVESWWEVVRQKRYVVSKHGHRGEVDFLKSLSFLNNDYIAVWGVLTSAKKGEVSDTDVLLLGPNGIWVFEVKFWNGIISRQDGVWVQETTHYEKGGVPVTERIPYPSGPDEQWLNQKDEITKTIRMRLQSGARLAELINGGIVFAHSNVKFGQITGQRAAYGTPGQWHKKIGKTPPVQGFSLEDRLLVLDALIQYANLHEREVVKIVSANKGAENLYQEASNAFREYVSAKVK